MHWNRFIFVFVALLIMASLPLPGRTVAAADRSGLTATAAGAAQTTLAWSEYGSYEAYFLIQSSPDTLFITAHPPSQKSTPQFVVTGPPVTTPTPPAAVTEIPSDPDVEPSPVTPASQSDVWPNIIGIGLAGAFSCIIIHLLVGKGNTLKS